MTEVTYEELRKLRTKRMAKAWARKNGLRCRGRSNKLVIDGRWILFFNEQEELLFVQEKK